MTLSLHGDRSAMPFKDYRSTMRVQSMGERGERCSVRWSATFTPLDLEDKVARLVGALYNAGLRGLQELVAQT